MNATAGSAGDTRHPARSGLSIYVKSASQKPFDGVPYTRLAAGLMQAGTPYMDQGCVRFKAPRPERLIVLLLLGGFFGQSKRLQLRHSLPNDLAIGLVFIHGLDAFLGALFLLETRFGAGSSLARPGLAGSGCQVWSPFGANQRTITLIRRRLMRDEYPAQTSGI